MESSSTAWTDLDLDMILVAMALRFSVFVYEMGSLILLLISSSIGILNKFVLIFIIRQKTKQKLG